MINEYNDYVKMKITHFSMDKGYHMGIGFINNGHDVYFMTTLESRTDQNGMNFININEADTAFLHSCDLIILVREGYMTMIISNYEDLKNFIINTNRKTKIAVKSDSAQWIFDKTFRNELHKIYDINASTNVILGWINKYIDIICVQTEEFKSIAVKNRVKENKIIISNMSIPLETINFDNLENPYDINHTYCVHKVSSLTFNKAFTPNYYKENPNKIDEFNKKKKIIIYTGRVKVDGGKIFFNMRNIMNILGNEYELHIFPCSFILPEINNNPKQDCSGKNGLHLEKLKNTIFNESKNVIVHYPYEHKDMYKYLYYADCAIDFSDLRPQDIKTNAGHAKVLEYCAVGVPIVCEENINNVFIIQNAKNGILLKGIASDEEYVEAIKKITSEEFIFNKKEAIKITLENENWNARAKKFIEDVMKME